MCSHTAWLSTLRVPFACAHPHAAATRCKFVRSCPESALCMPYSSRVPPLVLRSGCRRAPANHSTAVPFLADQLPTRPSSALPRCSGRLGARPNLATAGLGEMVRCFANALANARTNVHGTGGRTLAHAHTRTHARTHAHTPTRAQARTHTQTRARTHTRKHAHMHAHAHACTQA